jgi:hypothetical protein
VIPCLLPISVTQIFSRLYICCGLIFLEPVAWFLWNSDYVLTFLFVIFFFFLQDVASKIMAFSQQGPRTTCIISANGALCTAILRQPATSGGIVTYEVCLGKIISELGLTLLLHCWLVCCLYFLRFDHRVGMIMFVFWYTFTDICIQVSMSLSQVCVTSSFQSY